MQLAIASPDVDVDRIELVLAAWSQAGPAELACGGESAAEDAAARRPIDGQLALRLEDGQLPIWEARVGR